MIKNRIWRTYFHHCVAISILAGVGFYFANDMVIPLIAMVSIAGLGILAVKIS